MDIAKFKGKRAVAQLRVSSPGQLENTSLRTQEKEIKSYVKKYGIELVKLFNEEAVSGASLGKRVDLMKALDFCADKRNKIDLFITYRINRFTRDNRDYNWFMQQLDDIGVRLISCTEYFDESIEGEFNRDLNALLADRDRKDIIRKLGTGQVERYKEGKWPNNVPAGYMKENVYAEKCRDVIPDPERYPLIKTAWDMLLTGQYSSVEILDHLNNNLGYKTRKGKVLSKQTLSAIFANPFYAGHTRVRQRKSKYVNFEVPLAPAEHIKYKMIDISEWYKAQEILDKKAKAKYMKYNTANPQFELVKLLRCKNCGSILTGSFNKQKQRGYYRCYNSECSKNQSISQETVERIFFDFLESVKPEQTFIDGFERFLRVSYQSKDNVHLELAKAYEDQIEGLERKIVRIKEAYDAGSYTLEEMESKVRAAEEEIKGKGVLLKECLKPSQNSEKIIESNIKYLQHLPDHWRKLSPESKIRFHQILFPKGLVYNGDNKSGEICNHEKSFILQYIWRVREDLEKMVMRAGLEPATGCLRGSCSTN